MKVIRLLTVALICSCGSVGNAQEPLRIQDLKFDGIFASRPGDPREYMILGSGWLRVVQLGEPKEFIAHWLTHHPAASATPISSFHLTRRNPAREEVLVYLWIEDGASSLNVDLARSGVFPGGVMVDMVDSFRHLTDMMNDPRFAAMKAGIEKERAAAPQDGPARLVSDDDYQRRLKQVEEAELAAQSEKLGIWSDATKEEGQSEGYP
jgi:hypothetical protein